MGQTRFCLSVCGVMRSIVKLTPLNHPRANAATLEEEKRKEKKEART